MESAWSKDIEVLFDELKSRPHMGLCAQDAKERFAQGGANALPKKGKISGWCILFSQFSSPIIWLLIVAAIVAGFLGEFIDAWAIVIIVIFNAILSFFQEFRAEHSLEALQNLACHSTKVVRDGVLRSILIEEIVPGDLLLLESGERVPADGRIVNLSHLSVDESVLTGESVPVEKVLDSISAKALLSDRKNMVFRGTTVVSGKGHVLVTHTGLETEIGKIARDLAEEKREKTPLQLKLDHLGNKLVYLCFVIIFVVFALGIFRGVELVELVLVALSLAVAAIPEGLPAAVTIALSIGVRKMAKQRALVRRLSSVETLGSTRVICTDKTGTLTQSAMTVQKIYVDGQFHFVTGVGYEPKGRICSVSPTLEEALKIATLCNNANILEEEGRWVCTGDPTECALLSVAVKGGVNRPDLEDCCSVIQEHPFDSERKMMSVEVNLEGKPLLYIKGAPDVLIDRSNWMLIKGQEIPIERGQIEDANKALAAEAYRVLGVAYQKDIKKGEERDLVFVGLFGIIDPPRPEVKQAITECKEAGIQPVMVTGDHQITALAIAKELGISAEKVATGNQLDQMTSDQICEVTVFSRITANHKLRIVRAFRERGIVTAMTGDGVNDAPAIKAADIGIAMGVTGTDVTKESSDMIIFDDNFASIIQAVKWGRGIYDNIVKFVSYLLSSNIAEILVIFIPMLLGLKGPMGAAFVPLLPVQLLWMNFVTDGFPAIALALDPIDPHVMSRPPRPKDEQMLNRRFFCLILLVSLVLTGGALAACFWGLRKGVAHAQTMTFTSLIVLELVRAQMVRRQYHLGLFSNPYLIAALASSFLLQLAVVYVPPLAVVFGTVPLSIGDWGIIGGIAVVTHWLGNVITKWSCRI